MTQYAMGMMSGTSMDGIDVAVIDIHSHQLLCADTFPYSSEVSAKLKEVMKGKAFNASFFSLLNRQIGIDFAEAAQRILNLMTLEQIQDLQVIGTHGQTVCHQPLGDVPYTWQMGCPHTIAQICKKPVVFDFRNGNIAAGGQGAPLAPLYHQQLFGQKNDAIVVNIGGISNLSFVSPTSMRGYDVGPGNCLMDLWIDRNLGLSFDHSGAWAASGKVSQLLLSELLRDGFLQQNSPKSIGKEYYSMEWLDNYIKNFNLDPQDVQATLCRYTVEIIAREIKYGSTSKSIVWLCGGGAKNLEIVRGLQQSLIGFEVKLTSEANISEDYLEAMMIAWLGWMRYSNHPIDLYAIMGGHHRKQLVGMICE